MTLQRTAHILNALFAVALALVLLADDGVAWRDHLVLDGKPRCVVNANWKYLYWPDGFAELYDRESDPHELHNRINDPDLASVRNGMHATLTGA